MDLFQSTSSFQLNLRRPLLIFDLETTGTNIVSDRIVEISLLILQPDHSRLSKTYRINPTIDIPAEASAVHGIYNEDIALCPTFADLAAELHGMIDPCDFGGFNSNYFDIPLLLEEFIRVGYTISLDHRAMVDVHKIFTLYEKRTLEAAYKFYCDKELINAHSAEADVMATYEVLLAQLQRYADLKNDVPFLHAVSNSERFLDSGRRIVLDNGKAVFNFGKYKGVGVEDVFRRDPGYYSWMMNGEFPMHTKQKIKEIRERMR